MSKIKISSKDKMTNELNGHVENLKLMSMCDRVVFYSYLTEQVVIQETPIASRRHPSESRTLAIARNLRLYGSTRHGKIPTTLPHTILPDVRTMFSILERNKIPLGLVFN